VNGEGRRGGEGKEKKEYGGKEVEGEGR